MKKAHKITLGSLTAFLIALTTFMQLTQTTISQFTKPAEAPDSIRSKTKFEKVSYGNNFMPPPKITKARGAAYAR